MDIIDFSWSDEVVDKVIGKHGLFPEEIEEAFFCESKRLRRGKSGRYLLYSRTLAGAYILVIFEYEAGVAEIVTARSMTASEKKWFRTA